ncbi:MAG: LytTR family transcriptional regulator DNA-binding domain-containing protein [Defluviitaleaceae bacterium]|nr:LytTR family transcriptional regulator DNA-binding domain-containing protein [Defluviitaleaceae bacterium]
MVTVIVKETMPGGEDRVTFQVKEVTERIARAIEILEGDHNLPVFAGDHKTRVPYADISYIEAAGATTLVYAKDDVYQSKLKLSALEDELDNYFLRINKQVIVNLRKVQSVMPAGTGRFQATLKNGVKLIIARQFVKGLRERFGV